MKRRSRTQEESQPACEPVSPVLTIAETATLFRTTAKRVRNAIRNGELEAFKLGRTTYVLREPLEKRLGAPIGGAVLSGRHGRRRSPPEGEMWYVVGRRPSHRVTALPRPN